MKKIGSFFGKHKIIIIAGVLILTAVIAGQRLLKKDETSNSTTVTTAKAVKGNISSSVEASGLIETANYLAVTTSVNGIVKKVYVQEGDTVTKGQKIMDITLNSDGEESRASAYSSYLSAKSSLERAKSNLLTKESALMNAEKSFEKEKENNSYQTEDERYFYKLAENAYLVAKSDYELQKEEITQAEVALNKALLSYQAQSPTIVAPDSGIIANILVVEGMDISNSLSERTSTAVASVRKEGTPIASLNISEVDINKVKVGQKVTLTLNSIGDKQFTGKVAGIDKIGLTSSGVSNYPVIVKFDENSDMVLPNMGVDAEIITDEKSGVLIIPTSAIETTNNEKNVTLVKGDATEKVKVETGISSNKYTEITSGLSEGDMVQIKSLPTEGFTTSSGINNTNRNGGMPGGMGEFMR